MVRQRLFVIALLVVLLALSVPVMSAQEDAPVDTTFFLTFVPNIQFAPLYVGLEKGYFAEAGFNLALEHGDEPIGVDLIAANERQFGMVSGEQVIAARANGRPVVFVYEWFQQFPVGVLVTDNSGIEDVSQLAGQRVGLPGRFGASYSGVIALLSANGMTEQDVQLEEIGFNAPEVVCVGAIDAAVVYMNNEPLQIEARAAQGDCGDVGGVTVFPVGDYVDIVSNGIITSEQMIAEHPDQVLAMNTAFDRALRDVINNPAAAYLMSEGYVENLPLSDELRGALEMEAQAQAAFLADNPDADREAIAAQREKGYEALAAQFGSDDLLQYRVLLSSIALWDGDQLGRTNADSWEATQETLIAMGFLEAPISLEGAYSNDFLPEGEGE